ncbi:MAG TPA: HAD-IC family P-type ATPase [Dehalococcoidia bacterium]|nr:HAD-IC family P-type ATPase [Dehalococcoidia bacterium]
MANELAPTFDPGFLERGLSSAEAAARHARGEGNDAPLESNRSYRRIVFDNVVNPVHVILFVISGGLIALGLVGDAVLTAGLVLGNVAIGVFQEGRAKRQLDQIAILTRPQASVIRDGEERVIDPDEIVRGDLLVVRAGDQMQVDGPVLREAGLSVDEALLTGESDLIRKHVSDQLHSGSFCMTGEALLLAQGIGRERLSHRITVQARSFRNVRTPLQREVSFIIWAMALIVALLGLAVANSFLNLYGGLPLVESTRAAAVIVALVPQGLWFMITVAYSMAVVRTARGGVLIQRMNAVESISRVDVLCFDKTGTLTTNQLRLESLRSLGPDEASLRQRLGSFAASASFKNRTSAAIEEALSGKPREVRAEVVFDSARKWSALVLDDGVYVLGAPDVLSAVLTTELPAAELEAWTQQGLRVLLFAYRRETVGIDFDDAHPRLPEALDPLALVVLRDELRPDARETIERFGDAGVKLKILSGDHPDTVLALARQAGFAASSAISREDLDGLTDADFAALAMETDVFGRITPDDKQRLVRAFQSRGHYVAMTGDGINDIPALKTAQVAVVMRSGSPATRGVADIVLLDDSFGALSQALVEGQRIREGMEGIFRLFLVRTLSVALVILGAAIAGEAFPLTPRQTAVVATLTVGLPAVALAAWAKPERSPRLILPDALAFVLPAAATIGIAGFAVYLAYNEFDASLNEARTALTATLVLCGISLIPYAVHPPEAWLSLSPLRHRPDLAWLSLAMIGAFCADSAVPGLRRFFELQVLGVFEYVAIVGVVIAWALLAKLTWWLGAGRRIKLVTQNLLERHGPIA